MLDLNGILASLQGAATQETRLLRLTTPLGADVLLAECVRGEEGLGSGFRFEVAALSGNAAIPLRSLIGQPALLQLATTFSADAPRCFHGHITGAAMNGANGGLARYSLTIEPWTAFLGRTRDSRVFQDMSVCDIIDAVFRTWDGRGKLAPAWRFDLRDRSLYPVRSLTVQYQESDLAFVERLMSEEGLFHYVEHSGDPASPSLGSHVLVIADDNASFKPNAQASIRFTQPGAVMREDSLDRWRNELKLQTNAIDLRSWDYRTLDMRTVSAAASDDGGHPLISRDAPGNYAYTSREHGQRIAERQLQALEAQRNVYVGAGTVRTLAPGTTFTLGEHALFGSDGASASFLVTRVVHLMHNNLGAELKAGIVHQLGAAALSTLLGDELQESLHASGENIAERPLYRNRIDAIPSELPYRAARSDGHGRLLHPRPTITGQQTAVVVGPAGAVIHTDRDHRIKVQFHWQRGEQAHNRLVHPTPEGHTGAPADDSTGTWVRIATALAPVAGANWGGHTVPRVGQEVLIDFLDGNIDRPVVIGTVYNGKGQDNAQHNQVAQGPGASTGNAPAWFPGDTAAHAHPATLSGLKSQAMQASQAGSGAYGQLVFDDTPGQARTALQRHATAHDAAAELNLGALRHQTDNQRLAPVGFGAELKTTHSAALRAGKGMLLSTSMRSGARGSQLDAREAQSQIEQGAQLQTRFATTAQKHNAMLKTPQGAAEPAPETLPAIAQLSANANAVAATARGRADGDSGGAGTVTAFNAALMQLSTPSGIAALTPMNAIFSAAATTAMAASQDINLLAQAASLHHVRDGISLFTYGKASSAEKP
ncbi:MAG: type VI secretion system Vgr family protein, partial [Massilia sp.]